MPRDLVPHREGPKEEVSHEVVKHDRVWGDTLTRDINHADAAEDARIRSQADAHKRDFEMAKDRLAKLNYAQTMDFMNSMPVGVLELYLLAEEATKNRREVLQFYSKPGVKARQRWLPESLATVDA